jgi:hypothetical protein
MHHKTSNLNVFLGMWQTSLISTAPNIPSETQGTEIESGEIHEAVYIFMSSLLPKEVTHSDKFP